MRPYTKESIHNVLESKSSFKADLNKEKKLHTLLDHYYNKHLKNYSFERVHDLKNQLAGVDVLFKQYSSGVTYTIDEKAQLDYINDDLPTFAFEISYLKNENLKKGWLFDTTKKTDFYALVTAIYSDEPGRFTTCKITLVNRQKLLQFLEGRTIKSNRFENRNLPHGKTSIEELNDKREGYLYFSSFNKEEKPLNLILRLDFLIEQGIAKRLI